MPLNNWVWNAREREKIRQSIRRSIRASENSIGTIKDNFADQTEGEDNEEIEDMESEIKNEEDEATKKESEIDNNNGETYEEETTTHATLKPNKTRNKSGKKEPSNYQSNHLSVEPKSTRSRSNQKRRYKRHSQNNNYNNYNQYNNQDDYTYNQDNRNPEEEGNDNDLDQGSTDQIEEPRRVIKKHLPELMMTIAAPVFDTKNFSVS